MNNILASASLRRKGILEQLGILFTSYPADHEEIFLPAFSVPENCMAIAFQKARASYVKYGAEGFYIGADTTVVYKDEILNKPKDREDARRMLLLFRGKKHQVITGFCLLDTVHKWKIVDFDISEVRFRAFSKQELEEYLDSGEYRDKAGAYGIQGKAKALIDSYQGSLFNIIGLPVEKMSVYWEELRGKLENEEG